MIDSHIQSYDPVNYDPHSDPWLYWQYDRTMYDMDGNDKLGIGVLRDVRCLAFLVTQECGAFELRVSFNSEPIEEE